MTIGRSPYNMVRVSRARLKRREPLIDPIANGTFTRASSGAVVDPVRGWMYDATGSASLAGTDVRRQLRGYRLLMEVARTNYIADSRDASNASWDQKSGHTITTAYADGPDGSTTTADRIELTSGGYVGRNGGTIGICVGSHYAKAGPGYSAHGVLAGNGFTDGGQAESLLAQWRRFDVKNTSVVVANRYWYPADGTDRSSLGGATAGARDVVTDLSQLEAGAFPTSPIITSGGTATRAQDRWTLASGGSVLDSGVAWEIDIWPLMSNAEMANYGYDPDIVFRGSTSNNRLYLARQGGTPGFLLVVNGTVRAGINATWSRYQKLTLRVDWASRLFTLSGATTGNGSTAITSTDTWSTGSPAANLYLANNASANGGLAAVISPIYQVAA